MEAGLQSHRRPGHPQLGQPRGRRAPRARGFDRVMSASPREYGAAVICLLIDEQGQARDVEWKMEVAHRIHDLAVERYGLAASDLIFDALTFPLSTGDDDLRRDAMATIEAIRRIKAEIPGAFTVLGVSNVSASASAGGPPRAQLRVPARVRRGRARLGHRARRQDHAADPDPRGAARGLPRPHLRPPRTRRELRPAAALLEVFADVQTSTDGRRRTAPAGRSSERLQAPHHRRRPRRPRPPISTRRWPPASTALDDHQRRAARRHEGRRRAVRLGRDAAAVRAAVGRDDEDGGRLPRAAHGEGRRLDEQGPPRARHREGRRARHRQEPGRHHPHQQRLRGPQPRHQGARSPTWSRRPRRSRPTPSA